MVELGPLGPPPNTPASELINYWARGPGSEPLHKAAAEHCYTYAQQQHTPLEVLFGRRVRHPRYVVRVTEDHAGRRRVHTERFDPERGSGSRTGHGSPDRVILRRLPGSIFIPMAIFTWALAIIVTVGLPFPVNIAAVLLWSLSLSSRMFYGVQRARMAQHLRRLPADLPPLLSAKELDARVFALANPDEDRTFDVPPPIPMPQGLRDPAWKRWADKLAELSDQEYRVGRMTYKIKQNHGFADRTDHALYKFVDDIRSSAAYYGEHSRVESYVTNPETGVQRAVLSTVAREDHESLRPLFESLGREVLGPERVAELEDRRRAAAHGEPMLDRRFTARTDCADGHLGEHPILSTFTDSTGRKRVRRGCLWCPSVWSDRV